MLFNSLEFLIFLPLVFAVYWILNRWTGARAGLRLQNLLVLAVSYLFYGWWDWRFLSLIAFSTLVDFAVGLQIAKANHPLATSPQDARSSVARRWLIVSILVNLGLLGYFKYAGFFLESWVEAWSALGVSMHTSSLKIILPVGISFYTFQTLSYSIDIYRRKLEPTRDFIAFAAFVSFFPQLVAGPIERASALLPQIVRRREFSYDLAVSGMRLILWGFFKKVVVADTCAVYVNQIFSNPDAFTAPTLILGAMYFAIQVYGDFSGYSDIAIGTARLFGIRLTMNFKSPFFARDIAEFWRRWHISLTTWFRDYLYYPLGGSRGGKAQAIRNTFVIFLVSGFWHGANWTFLLWGLIHAVLFLPLLITGRNRRNTGDIEGLPSFQEILGIGWTFMAFAISMVVFRSETVGDAGAFLWRWFDSPATWTSIYPRFRNPALLSSLFLMFAVDWAQRSGREMAFNWRRIRFIPDFAVSALRWAAMLSTLIWVGTQFYSDAAFIYFQF
jgi:D-alanyl-lipoteichoic acid acyltransferase DltB (MBOAT superfamily)